MDHLLEFVSVFLAGLLGGAELVVRFGVRDALNRLDERPQLQLRQALIRRLRILVPAIYGPTALTAIAVTVTAGTGAGFGFRLAGLVAVVAWTVVTFTGTVPINSATLTWSPDAPPANWRDLVRRWERLDSARTVAAVLAFSCFLVALALAS